MVDILRGVRWTRAALQCDDGTPELWTQRHGRDPISTFSMPTGSGSTRQARDSPLCLSPARPRAILKHPPSNSPPRIFWARASSSETARLSPHPVSRKGTRLTTTTRSWQWYRCTRRLPARHTLRAWIQLPDETHFCPHRVLRPSF
jgi:hypothetical protein